MYIKYSLTPKKTNNLATVLVGLLFVAAILFLLFPIFFKGIAYEGILQTACLFFVIAALAVMSRYFFKSFTYEVRESEEGEYDFDVVETQGKRRYTVCRIALKNIERVEIMTEKSRKSLKKEFSGRKKFYYLPEILPARSITVFVTECGEPLVLVLAYDETLEKMLAPDKK